MLFRCTNSILGAISEDRSAAFFTGDPHVADTVLNHVLEGFIGITLEAQSQGGEGRADWTE